MVVDMVTGRKSETRIWVENEGDVVCTMLLLMLGQGVQINKLYAGVYLFRG